MQATGKKPTWETGASMALPRRALAAAAQRAAPSKAAWSLAPDDDAELLDDSELLTEEDLQRPSVPCTPLTCVYRLILAIAYCQPNPLFRQDRTSQSGARCKCGVMEAPLCLLMRHPAESGKHPVR